ncbi:MAG: type II secretion system major pseudopilin GspG [Candidatus Omnitrophica bacterium]|nr:type II secretion system major pseudopilin GspG [Candidatus Omnitrophota bacterium]MCM8793842.1 type II secretion system major pseudopilin GspG [Candidatus Omnitrophota bacterium]
MKRGFTLVELMLVVIILGILVGMVVPRLVGRSEEARIAAAKADIQGSIATALDLYEMDVGTYPEELKELCEKPSDEKKAKRWKGPYLKKCAQEGEEVVIPDPWGNPYKYQFDRDKGTYLLYSFGPDEEDQGGKGGDDISNLYEKKREE